MSSRSAEECFSPEGIEKMRKGTGIFVALGPKNGEYGFKFFDRSTLEEDLDSKIDNSILEFGLDNPEFVHFVTANKVNNLYVLETEVRKRINTEIFWHLHFARRHILKVIYTDRRVLSGIY